MAAPGLVSPDSFPTRSPMDRNLANGRVQNPPRMYEIGGAYTMALWTKEVTPTSFAQSPQTNIARVRKPTEVRMMHRSSREND